MRARRHIIILVFVISSFCLYSSFLLVAINNNSYFVRRARAVIAHQGSFQGGKVGSRRVSPQSKSSAAQLGSYCPPPPQPSSPDPVPTARFVIKLLKVSARTSIINLHFKTTLGVSGFQPFDLDKVFRKLVSNSVLMLFF